MKKLVFEMDVPSKITKSKLKKYGLKDLDVPFEMIQRSSRIILIEEGGQKVYLKNRHYPLIKK